jgi:adhesin transport system outer membrane protein
MINYIEINYKSILLLLTILLFNQTANSLTLMEVVHHVLDTHPVIMANEKSVDAFQYRYHQTFGSFLPEVSMVRIHDRERTNNDRSNISRRYFNTRVQDFSLKQNLFAGFKDFNANRAAMWRYNSTKENVFYNINAQVLDAIITYISVLQQAKLVTVAEENQKFFRKALNNLEKLFESGATDKADYLLVKNNLENARSTMLQAKKDYDSAVSKFKNSINLDPVELAPLKSVSKYILSDPEAIIEAALENSPSLKETRAKLKTLEYEFREQVATLFPTLDFNVSKNMQTNTTGIKGKAGTTKVGVTANFNLFRGGQDYLEAQAKAAERVSLDHQLEATTRTIKEDVTETWLTIKNTLEKKEFIEKQIISAEQSLNSYLILFDYNQAYLLSVLNAKKVLFASQTENILNNSNKIIQEHRMLLLNNTLIPTLEEVYSFNNM